MIAGMKTAWMALAMALSLAPQRTCCQEQARSVTVIAVGHTHDLEKAMVTANQLLIPIDAIGKICGFELKSQGLCAGELCVPIPADSNWLVERDDARWFDATAFAAHIDQAVASTADGSVWSFSRAPVLQGRHLPRGIAPDFTLPDRNGRPVSLSDFLGKKVFLLTWASW